MFAVNTQHDADEVFVAIMNLIQQQMEDASLVGLSSFLLIVWMFSCSHCLCFLLKAHEIQNLYRICVETHVQCLECSSVQSRGSYLLSLPLHIQEDHNSLVKSHSNSLRTI